MKRTAWQIDVDQSLDPEGCLADCFLADCFLPFLPSEFLGRMLELEVELELRELAELV